MSDRRRRDDCAHVPGILCRINHDDTRNRAVTCPNSNQGSISKVTMMYSIILKSTSAYIQPKSTPNKSLNLGTRKGISQNLSKKE